MTKYSAHALPWQLNADDVPVGFMITYENGEFPPGAFIRPYRMESYVLEMAQKLSKADQEQILVFSYPVKPNDDSTGEIIRGSIRQLVCSFCDGVPVEVHGNVDVMYLQNIPCSKNLWNFFRKWIAEYKPMYTSSYAIPIDTFNEFKVLQDGFGAFSPYRELLEESQPFEILPYATHVGFTFRG